MMVERKTGLIVIVSSMGGIAPLFNCAYGIGKAACDRMAADCAIELKDQNVAMISLWPGAVSTETFVEKFVENGSHSVGQHVKFLCLPMVLDFLFQMPKLSSMRW